ncbi:hypothetical protein OEZ85_013495 [Tetradesmus obliquus]|uniref:SGNH hydrolase-type esterase domain-containing protein n=1 Tax=Tetradesmus obliquus TaxID=3088 RepID=A0ABY8UR06_TETOB|nr:hypothetical protein OEZ85_013495 [Tetradesmus obliquus]
MTFQIRTIVSLSIAVIVLSLLLAGPSTAQQSQAKPTETLKSMLKAQVFGPEWLLSKGFNGDIDARNWRRLAQKLATPGSKIQVVTFGGSVTAGHLPEARNCSWVEQAEVWMKAAFPAVRFEVLNLARGATDVTAASTCWYNHVPANTDLIFIEYSANGCTRLQCTSIMSPLVADYESLLRRVMRRAPNAALMSLAIFAFYSHAGTAQNGKNTTIPTPYYNTGEDMHAVLARRYGVPMVSVRDALYNMMWDESALRSALGYGRKHIMKDDIHPAFVGHDLYGRGLVAWAMRYILTRELTALSSTAVNNNINNKNNNFGKNSLQLSLPSPVSPIAAREADGDTFCAEGAWFQKYVVKSSAAKDGWQWFDETTPINLKYCDHFNCHRLGYRATGAGKSLDIQVATNNVTTQSRLEKRALVIFFTRSPFKDEMGIARVSCISGCSCSPIELDGYNDDFYATLGAGSTSVTAHPQCLVRVTILDKSNSGGHMFKVDGVAVVPYTDSNPLTPIDKLALQGLA